MPRKDDIVQVLAATHPMRGPDQWALVPSGQSIDELLPCAHALVQVHLNGELLLRENWGITQTQPGDHILVRAIPGNSGIIRAVALLAIVVASIFTFGFAALLTGSYLAAAAAAAAVTIGGNLLLNAVVPPQLPQSITTPTGVAQAGLTGVSNQLLPYVLLPRIYGKRKVYPRIVGKPYTEIIGNDQYLRVLFCVGIGDYQLSALQIGDTSINGFSDVQVYTLADVIGAYAGLSILDPSLLYSRDVNEIPLSIELTQHTGPATVLRTTAVDTQEIGLDFVMPQGLLREDNHGERFFLGVELQILYSVAGAGVWSNAIYESTLLLSSNVIKTLSNGNFVLVAKTLDTQRAGLTWKVPSGTWDVQITPAATAHYGKTADSLQWGTNYALLTKYDVIKSLSVIVSALRSWQSGAPVSADLAANSTLVAMRVKATNQLHGTLNRFNLVAETKLPVYDGTVWTTEVTRNPTWAYVDTMVGPAAARPLALSRLDLTDLLAWAADNDTALRYYDDIIISAMTVFEQLRVIAAAGRASFGMRDGLYTVVRDLGGLVPTQVFTPRNSWGFSSTKSFVQQPDALKIQWINPAKDWQQDELFVYADGFNADGSGGLIAASKFETMVIRGVTNQPQAWAYGRFNLAQARLRPEIYTLQVDVENLACTRGDLVRVNHDIPLWGVGFGRIKAVVGIVITLDDVVALDGVSAYSVRIRTATGVQLVSAISAGAGDVAVFTLLDAVTGYAVGDLVAVGLTALETVPCKVLRIVPEADLSATLTLVDEAPGILTADTGMIPAYQTFITQPVVINQISPPVPIVDYIRSDESVLRRDADGSLHVQMVAYFHLVGQIGLPALYVEARLREAGTTDLWRVVGPVSADSGLIIIGHIKQQETYDLQLRSTNGVGLASDWSVEQSELIIGESTPPQDVTGFHLYQNGNSVIIRWDQVSALDLAGYEIRIMNQSQSFDWDRASVLTKVTRGTQITTATIAPGTWWVGIVAVDTSGNYSVNPSTASIKVQNGYNVIQTQDESPSWGGLKAGWAISGTDLILDETTLTRADGAALEGELIENGDASSPYQTNWSSWTLLPVTDAVIGSQVFEATGNGTVFTTDRYIPVSKGSAYSAALSTRYTGTVQPTIQVGLLCYDINGVEITPQSVYTVGSTLTTLTADANIGDTTVTLSSSANWGITSQYYVAFAANSSEADLPNFDTAQIQSISGSVVTLVSPLVSAHAVGSYVRCHQTGAAFPVIYDGLADATWTNYSGTLYSPDGVSILLPTNRLRIRTAFIRLAIQVSDVATGAATIQVDAASVAKILATYRSAAIGIGFVDHIRIWTDITASASAGSLAVPPIFMRSAQGLSVTTLLWATDSTTLMWTVDSNLMWTSSWSNWLPWTVGLQYAQLVQLEMRYDVGDGSPTVAQVHEVFDVLPRSEFKNGVAVPVAGLAVTFDKEFHIDPSLTINVVGASYFVVRTGLTTTAFNVQLFDSTDTAVAGTIDWVASTG